MITVIIAGGSGTRLWPLSTPEYPKHLLSLTNEKSLTQNTLERIKKITKTDRIFVITDASHSHHIIAQLTPDLPKENILIEPDRRGTANCVLMGLAHVKKLNLPKDEPILFVWADHLIRDNNGFAATVLRAGEINKSEKRLVYIGVEPTYPTTGLGYMQKGDEVDGWVNAYDLVTFKEKPDKRTAEQFYTSGHYVWNTGYLVASRQTLEEEMNKHSKSLKDNYTKLVGAKDFEKTYSSLPNLVMEYELSEKLNNAVVTSGTFDWVDIGNFQDLHAVSLTDDEGNHVRGEGVELESTTNSYIRNEDSEPVAVIGLDNVVVVNTPNGVLVTNKNYAHKVGDIAKKIQSRG